MKNNKEIEGVNKNDYTIRTVQRDLLYIGFRLATRSSQVEYGNEYGHGEPWDHVYGLTCEAVKMLKKVKDNMEASMEADQKEAKAKADADEKAEAKARAKARAKAKKIIKAGFSFDRIIINDFQFQIEGQEGKILGVSDYKPPHDDLPF